MPFCTSVKDTASDSCSLQFIKNIRKHQIDISKLYLWWKLQMCEYKKDHRFTSLLLYYKISWSDDNACDLVCHVGLENAWWFVSTGGRWLFLSLSLPSSCMLFHCCFFKNPWSLSYIAAFTDSLWNMRSIYSWVGGEAFLNDNSFFFFHSPVLRFV